MTQLRDIVQKVRSKNAGPFWLTIDIFCGDAAAFAQVRDGLSSDRVAALFKIDVATLKRFDIADLNVVKFSMPRPVVQGHITDRDMHGAGWAPLLADISMN